MTVTTAPDTAAWAHAVNPVVTDRTTSPIPMRGDVTGAAKTAGTGPIAGRTTPSTGDVKRNTWHEVAGLLPGIQAPFCHEMIKIHSEAVHATES